MTRYVCRKCNCHHTNTVQSESTIQYFCSNCDQLLGAEPKESKIGEPKMATAKPKQPKQRRDKNVITAVIDTREKTPLDLKQWGLDVVSKKLAVGDYSILYPDMRADFCIERKSINDFVMCVTRERERFMREMQLIRAYKYRAVVCEFSMNMIEAEVYRSTVSRDSVLGTIDRLTLMGIPVYLCDDRSSASRRVANLMRIAVRDEVEKAKYFVNKQMMLEV